ncbi:hypothetical protein GCM10009859_04400 [Kocuria salsicia]
MSTPRSLLIRSTTPAIWSPTRTGRVLPMMTIAFMGGAPPFPGVRSLREAVSGWPSYALTGMELVDARTLEGE